MEILGKLGIDIKLLIAQIINFGLLLWILRKFLFAPLIRRIEEDERQLKEAKIQQEKLEKERKSFEEQKEKELALARKKAEEIIAEAHSLAAKIEAVAKEKVEKEKAIAISQWEKHLETLELTLKKDLKRKAYKEVIEELRKYFLGLPKGVQKTFQDFFWEELIKEVKRVNFGKKTAKKPQRELGDIVLESVFPIEKNKLEELELLISKKIGFKIKIENKINKELISGFRLEILGIVLESNLLFQINNEKTSRL